MCVGFTRGLGGAVALPFCAHRCHHMSRLGTTCSFTMNPLPKLQAPAFLPAASMQDTSDSLSLRR